MNRMQKGLALVQLQQVGYAIVQYPDITDPTVLIIKAGVGGRTVTTLPVKDGCVCADSVNYLVSEAKYENGADRG